MRLTTTNIFMALAAAAALAFVSACSPSPEPEVDDANKTSLVLQDGQWREVAAASAAATTSLSDIRAQYQGGDYGEAIDAVEIHLERFSGDPSCQEATFLAGESEMRRGDLYAAFEWYEQQIRSFRSGEFLEPALLQEVDIGKRFLAGEKRHLWSTFSVDAEDEGLEILERVIEHAPGTVLAESVALYIGSWHDEQGEWVKAIGAYDRFLKLFPNSRQASTAMLQAARATLNMYQGASYDETPLLDARQRFLVVREQFPDLVATEGVDKALTTIMDAQAERLLTRAEFYERTERLDSAVYYYQKVLNEYPRSYHTVAARDALARLGFAATVPTRSSRPEAAPVRPPAADRQPLGAAGVEAQEWTGELR
jgi:outer membrane protein assembly factor BamD (BamD/ComL family)